MQPAATLQWQMLTKEVNGKLKVMHAAFACLCSVASTGEPFFACAFLSNATASYLQTALHKSLAYRSILCPDHHPSSDAEITVKPWASVRIFSNLSGSSYPHVCHSPPPYVSTPTCRNPSPDFLLIGLTRRHGESVWAPIMAMGFPGFHFSPTANATRVVVLRVK